MLNQSMKDVRLTKQDFGTPLGEAMKLQRRKEGFFHRIIALFITPTSETFLNKYGFFTPTPAVEPQPQRFINETTDLGANDIASSADKPSGKAPTIEQPTASEKQDETAWMNTVRASRPITDADNNSVKSTDTTKAVEGRAAQVPATRVSIAAIAGRQRTGSALLKTMRDETEQTSKGHPVPGMKGNTEEG